MSEEYLVPSGRVEDMKRILAIVAKGGVDYFRRPTKIVVNSNRDESRFVLEFDKEVLMPLSAVLATASDEIRSQICTELVRAVAFLHTAQVYHRHLTSEDVLLTADCHVRVTNFLQSVSQFDSAAVYVCGRNYRPPEVIMELPCSNNAAIDTWSLGCLIFEVLTGHALFVLLSSKDSAGLGSPALKREQLSQIVDCLGTPAPADVAAYPPNVQKGILNMREGKRNLRARLVEADVKNVDSWFNVIQGLLCFHPEKRSSVLDLLRLPLFSETS
jgi:serine/threonine protein kinase